MARIGLIVGMLVVWVLSGLLAEQAYAYGPTSGALQDHVCYYTYQTGMSGAPGFYNEQTHVGACGATYQELYPGDRSWLMGKLHTDNRDYTYTLREDLGCTDANRICSFYLNKVYYTGTITSYFGQIQYSKRTDHDWSCGPNAQSNGSGCVCKAGYVQVTQGGGCVPQPVCPPMGTKVPDSDDKTYLSSGGTASYMGCIQGCLVSGAFGARSGNQSYVAGPLVHVGQVCNPAGDGGTYGGMDPGNAQESCPAPKCPGSVNGTSVCVPCDGSTSTGDYNKPSNSQTGGGTDTTTTCTNGVCTTTTNDVDKDGNQIPGAGGHVGPGGSNPQADGTSGSDGECTGSDCEEQPKFCEDNPDSVICKSSTWGGTCESQFSCDGDAVQCAIAREQHLRNCTLFSTETDYSQKGRDAANGQAQPTGHPGATAGNTPIDFSQKIDTSNALVGTCPAGRSVSLMGQDIVLLTADQCDALAMVGQVLVGICSLACVAIVFK